MTVRVSECQTLTPLLVTFQDPVYGKGKLAEIQGLILGMLDTFNYEQVKLFGFSERTGEVRLKLLQTYL